MKKLLLILNMLLTAYIGIAQNATQVSVTGSGSALTIPNNSPQVVDDGIVVTANGTITDFTISITGSYTSGDILAYNGTLPSGITASAFNVATRSLQFFGTASAITWQDLLRRVTIRTTSATCFPEQRQVSFTIGNTYYNPVNNHFYKLYSSGLSWTASRDNAANTSYFGYQGYLATITSTAENNFITAFINNNSWIGCSDNYQVINAAVNFTKYANQAAAEGKFHWVTGPEKGTQMRTGNASGGNLGIQISGVYGNWENNEPNDYPNSGTVGEEDYGHLYASIGTWNDFPNDNSIASIIEFGGMPNDLSVSDVVFTRNINVNGAPTSAITGGNTSVCPGGSATLTLPNFNGTVVRWEYSVNDFITQGVAINNTTTTLNLTNLTETRYYRAVVNISSPTCNGLATSSTKVEVKTVIPGNVIADMAQICAGGTIGLSLFGNSGDVVDWQVSTNANFSPFTTINSTSTSINHTLASNGTYYFRARVQYPGCGTPVATPSATVTVVSGTPPIGGNVSSVTHCGGSNSGSLTLSGHTGTVQKWQYSIDGGVVWTDIANTSTTQSYSGISQTHLYRAVLQNGSCGTTFSNPGTVTVYNFTATNSGPKCTGTTLNLGVIANAGNGPFTYSWTGPNNFTSSDQNPSIPNVSAAAAGTYTVSVGAPGCNTSVSTTASILNSPNIASITPGSRCGTGTVTLYSSPGSGSVKWYASPSGGTSLATGTSYTTPSISTTTSYYVEADNGTCQSPVRIEITATVNAIPTITATTPGSRCGTGTVNLSATPSAGTVHWWTAATGGTELGQGTDFTTPTIASSTTYYAQAEVGGCLSSSRTAVLATINANPMVTSSAQINVACNGGATGAASINLPTGGAGSYSYDWAPGNPDGDGTRSVTGLTAGTWTVTVTDGNNCTATHDFTITQPSALSVTAASQTNVACNGGATGAASINLPTGGAGSYSYDWAPGSPAGDGTRSVSGLTAGTWTATVTDANNCTAATTFTITEPNAGTFTLQPSDQTVCAGDTAVFTAEYSGGQGTVTYQWQWLLFGFIPADFDGETNPTFNMPVTSTILSGSIYRLKVTDDCGEHFSNQVRMYVNPTYASFDTLLLCGGQTSYTLQDGTVVSQQGDYKVSYQTVLGCDSTFSTHINVGPNYYGTVDASICQGADYELPDGSKVNTAGDYTVTLQNSTGCDSVIVTHLSVKPTYYIEQNAQICSGNSYLLPDGSQVNTAGDYPVTLQSAQGCDSTIVTHLQLFVSEFTQQPVNQTVCQGDTAIFTGLYNGTGTVNYQWQMMIPFFGILIPGDVQDETNPTFKMTVTSPFFSGSIYRLKVTDDCGEHFSNQVRMYVNPVFNSFDTLTLCGNETYTLQDGNIVNQPGDYKVSYQTVLGCDSTFSTHIDAAPAFNSSVDASICQGAEYELPDGSKVNTAGDYTVTLQSSAGCDSVIVTHLTVNPEYNNTIEVAICQGGSYTLPDGSEKTVSGIYPVTLHTAQGCDSVIVTDLKVHPVYYSEINNSICEGSVYILPDGSQVSAGGDYTVTLQTAQGCDSTIVTHLDFKPSAFTQQPVDQTVCAGDTARFTGAYNGTGTVSYQWQMMIPFLGILIPGDIENETNPTFNMTLTNTFLSGSIYRLKVTDECGEHFSNMVRMYVNPSYLRRDTVYLCPNESFTLADGNVVSSSGDYPVVFPTIKGCDSTIVTTIIAKPPFRNQVEVAICDGERYELPDGTFATQAGDYEVVIPSTGGCDSIIVTVLTVNPTYNRTVEAAICEGQSYELPDGSLTDAAGEYPVILHTANGCDSTIVTVLNVYPVYNNEVEVSICAEESYMLPNGVIVNVAGEYPVTLQTMHGCDSLITTKLYVNPKYSNTVQAAICQGESYTLPDGSEVSAGGSYDVHLQTISGCDSLIVTELTVNPTFHAEEDASICEGSNYTLPNGRQVDESGDYTSRFQTTQGCDSTIVTHLIVNPSPVIMVDAQICEGDFYQLPNGTTTNQPGDHSVVMQTVAGCDSTIITTLQVNPVYDLAYEDSFCEGSTYTLPDGTEVDTVGVFTVTIPASTGCDSTLTITLHLQPGFESNVSVLICANETYTLPDGREVSEAGLYVSHFQTTAGCDSTINTTVGLKGGIVSTVEATVCQGEEFTLPDGNTVHEEGFYPVTLQTASGCDSTIITHLIVKNRPETHETVLICSGSSYTLPDGRTVKTAGEYTSRFQAANGCDSLVVTTLNVKPANSTTVNARFCVGGSYTLPNNDVVYIPGTYTTTWPAADGCDSSIVTILKLYAPADTAYIAATICSNETYQLPDGQRTGKSGVYTSLLQTKNGCDSVIVTSLVVNPTKQIRITASICEGSSYTLPNGTNVTAAGTYETKLQTSAGCDSLVTTFLIVYPSYIQVRNATVCQGDSILLPGGSYASEAGTYRDTLSAVFGCDSIIITNVKLTPFGVADITAFVCQGEYYVLPSGLGVNQPGTYTDTLQTVAGCDSIITINLSVYMKPNVHIDALDSSYCLGAAPLTLSATPPGGTFYGFGLAGNIFSINAAGIGSWPVYYEYTSAQGCTAVDTAYVNVEKCPDTGIEDALSGVNFQVYPNPVNDVLNVVFDNGTRTKAQLNILDASGRLILGRSAQEFNGDAAVRIDVSSYAPGVYIIQLYSNKQVYTSRFVVK